MNNSIIILGTSLFLGVALAAGPVNAAVDETGPAQKTPASKTPSSDTASPAEETKPGEAEETPKPEEPAVTVETAEPEPTPQPERALSLRERVDSLSQADLHEVITLMKANYIRPEALSEEELGRAALEGLLTRVGAGAMLLSVKDDAAASKPRPFLAEILDDRIGYIRLGSLVPSNIQQMDSSLENFKKKALGSLVLDLRDTPSSTDFDQAVEVLKRFVPKGKLLFSLRNTSGKAERIFTSNQEPSFTGLVTILVDGDVAGPAEVTAAALKRYTRSMIIGETTAGQTVEYEDMPLKGGQILRVAVGEVLLGEGESLFPGGLEPDIVVVVPLEEKSKVLEASLKEGVGKFVFDRERARINEAALVAGTNPELDAYQAARREGRVSGSRLRDIVLQRAVDLITTIEIFEGASAGQG